MRFLLLAGAIDVAMYRRAGSYLMLQPLRRSVTHRVVARSMDFAFMHTSRRRGHTRCWHTHRAMTRLTVLTPYDEVCAGDAVIATAAAGVTGGCTPRPARGDR
jgi:hypothetical protein